MHRRLFPSAALLLRAAALAAGCLLFVSCSQEAKHPAAMEAVELLGLLEEHQKRHDPQGYVEVDLGRFAVTHPLTSGDGAVTVCFHLFGVLPSERKAALEHAMPGFAFRLRDAAIALVQKIETDHLTDPGLSLFKAELVAALNRVLQERLLRDVVFSDFSISAEMETPWPAGAAQPEKPKGGHGGHGGH